MIELGFLSEQTADCQAGLKPKQIEKLQEDSEFKGKIEGENKEIIKKEVKSEVETAIENLEEGFYKFIKHQLKQYEFIDLEHIQKAFNQSVIKVNNEINNHTNKLRDDEVFK